CARTLPTTQQWGRQSHHDARLSPIKSGVRTAHLTPRAVGRTTTCGCRHNNHSAWSVQRIEQIGNGFHAGGAPSVLSVSNPFNPLKSHRPFNGLNRSRTDYRQAANRPFYPFPIRPVGCTPLWIPI